MRAHGTRGRSSDERDATNRQVAAVSAPVQRMLDLQRLAGNAAVARSVETERHRHGPGCGHAGPAVQRREAPHEHGPGCGHGAVEATGPTAQRSLLDAARNTPSTSLPGAFLAKAKPFFQNDRLSEGRVHDNPIAQRATAALGAEAMTVGKHIFLGPKAVGNTKTLAHEASHLDKNIRGIPETGNNHGAGLTVTDPGQGSERAADTDSDAFMSGAGTAPSVVAQRSVGEQAGDTDQAVQRSTGTGGGGTVQRAGDDALRTARNPAEMIAALEASGHSKDDAWELMQYMGKQQFPAGEGQVDFDMLSHIKDVEKHRIPPVRKTASQGLLAKRWTIRHYTGDDPKSPPTFRDIMSTYDNAKAGGASANTNVADWRSLGNIKFSFYLVAVDGKVPDRNWLNNKHWYAEWDLDSISDCWVSADLLERMNKDMDADGAREALKGAHAFRGSGTKLKELLAASAFGAGNEPAAALDAAIGGAFELKVPNGLPVSKWHPR